MHYRTYIFASASMGGTGSLIFAMRHPELVDGLVVLGAATSLRRYRDWCASGELNVLKDIRKAIDASYTEADLAANDVCQHSEALSMPLRFYHSVADRVIPIGELRELQRRMSRKRNVRFTELPALKVAPDWWNDHDAPREFFAPAVREVLRDIRR